jgi:hypothetical protein
MDRGGHTAAARATTIAMNVPDFSAGFGPSSGVEELAAGASRALADRPTSP